MRDAIGAVLATLIVVCCATTALHAAPRTTVAVDLSSLDAASYREIDGLALEKRIVLRFIQEGFAVVGVQEHPDIVVAIRLANASVILEARSAQGIRSREIARHEDSLAELHLEITQKAAELVRSIPLGAPSVERVAPVVEAPSIWEPWRVEPSAGVDVVWRSGGFDVAPRLGIRFGAALAGVASAAVAVSSGPGISVQEWQPQLGATYRLRLGTTTAVEAGVLAGVIIEHFSVSDPMAQDSRGTVVDLIGSLPVSVSFAPAARWLLGFRVAPGLASEGRRHTFDGATIWERGAFRMEAGINGAFRW
jgi:hypothetical protein